jgi:hypothetical protein
MHFQGIQKMVFKRFLQILFATIPTGIFPVRAPGIGWKGFLRR